MRQRLTLGLAALLAAACFEGPSAGEVTLVLGTPNTNDGAVSFAVMVAAPNEITGATAACDGCEVFYAKVSSTELRGIVTGDLVPGPVVRLAVAQGGPNAAYRLDVLEAANRQFEVVPPTGYTLTVQP